MKTYRKELWYETTTRKKLVNITEEVRVALKESGIKEGLCFLYATHVNSCVLIDDEEYELHGEYEKWLEPSESKRSGSTDALLKRAIMGRETLIAISGGKLDFGHKEQIFYGEFDKKQKKRVLIKIMGE